MAIISLKLLPIGFVIPVMDSADLGAPTVMVTVRVSLKKASKSSARKMRVAFRVGLRRRGQRVFLGERRGFYYTSATTEDEANVKGNFGHQRVSLLKQTTYYRWRSPYRIYSPTQALPSSEPPQRKNPPPSEIEAGFQPTLAPWSTT